MLVDCITKLVNGSQLYTQITSVLYNDFILIHLFNIIMILILTITHGVSATSKNYLFIVISSIVTWWPFTLFFPPSEIPMIFYIWFIYYIFILFGATLPFFYFPFLPVLAAIRNAGVLESHCVTTSFSCSWSMPCAMLSISFRSAFALALWHACVILQEKNPILP